MNYNISNRLYSPDTNDGNGYVARRKTDDFGAEHILPHTRLDSSLGVEVDAHHRLRDKKDDTGVTTLYMIEMRRHLHRSRHVPQHTGDGSS